MATNLISFPFRLAPNGSVVTRRDDSPEYIAEEIAQLVLTKAGERPQVPTFGLIDPTYHQIDPHELALKVNVFAIPARVTNVLSKQITNDQQDAVVSFESLEDTGPYIRTVATNGS